MRKIVLGIAFTVLVISPVNAATKVPVLPIALSTLTPAITASATGGDQVSQLLASSTNLFLLGTIESPTFPLVSSAPLGGSDGFITALSTQGAKLWDLRLGTAGDDVATAGCIDLLGNIWVAGASAISGAGTTPAPGLNRLTVWEISSTGILINTFTKDLPNVDIPTSIALKGPNFIIQGVSSAVGLPTFAVSVTPRGAIGTIKTSAVAPVGSALTFNATSSAYSWKSFITKSAIKGVTGIPSHHVTPILSKSSLKDKSLKGIYAVQGSPISLQYQAGLGVLLLSQGSSGYFVTIVHTK